MYDDIEVAADLLPGRSFFFLRHGETQYNLERRFQGAIDVPLNETGMLQAQRAAAVLRHQRFTRLVSSPANRVLKTASYTVEATGIPMHVDSDLMEFNVGSFEGRNIEEVKREFAMQPGDSFLRILPEDAEDWQDFVPRVCGAVSKWTESYPQETVLVVAHGLVFSALCIALGAGHLSSQNAQPWSFRSEGGNWTIEPLANESA